MEAVAQWLNRPARIACGLSFAAIGVAGGCASLVYLTVPSREPVPRELSLLIVALPALVSAVLGLVAGPSFTPPRTTTSGQAAAIGAAVGFMTWAVVLVVAVVVIASAEALWGLIVGDQKLLRDAVGTAILSLLFGPIILQPLFAVQTVLGLLGGVIFYERWNGVPWMRP